MWIWIRRRWYLSLGYVLFGIFVAFFTGNFNLDSILGVIVTLLAIALWPFIVIATLLTLLFHIPNLPNLL
jgi:hypothetical protein